MNIGKLLKAFLVPLAFVACSEDGNLLPNAPSGESNVLLSSSDGAIASSSSEQIDGSEKIYRGIKIYSGTFFGNRFLGDVCIYELDPVTFDTTRFVPFSRTFYNTSYGMDSIVIDSLSLRSPYIMLTTEEYSMDPFEARHYNVVDIREADAFAFDKKTYLESIRTLYLVRSGKSFAEAKKQASKEVLEAFGSFANVFDKSEAENIQNADYRNYLAFIKDFLEFTTEDTVAAKFEKCGDMTCGTEFLKIRFLTEAVDMLFLGNSYYAFTIDPEVRAFIRSLDKGKVGRIVNFGSAAMLNSTWKKVKAEADKVGIPTDTREFHCKGEFKGLHKGRPN